MNNYSLIGLGLFIVGRLDKRDSDLKMEIMRNETRADKLASDLKMEIMRNETRADKLASDLKMDRMRTETLVNNGFTLFVAILGIIIPILTKSK